MNAASVRVFNAKTFPFTSATPTVDSHLRNVAATFSLLYENRQAADYELAYAWSRTDVLTTIDSVANAFKSLRAIRSDPVTNAYLLSLFVKDRK